MSNDTYWDNLYEGDVDSRGQDGSVYEEDEAA